MAETTAIATILEMVGEYRTPVHFMRLSTARGIDLVAQGKAQQLPITASVNWMHLLWNTDQLESYDPNLRLAPPLGNETDRLALIQGLKSGIIDAIAVDHRAYTYEEKTLAFAEAPPGAIGLELALPCLWQGLVATEMLTALELWQALSLNPRYCLGLDGKEPTARYVLFDPQAVWTVDGTNLKTLGRNTPYLGQTLQGKVQNIFLAPELT
jgi:dihydroorotase